MCYRRRMSEDATFDFLQIIFQANDEDVDAVSISTGRSLTGEHLFRRENERQRRFAYPAVAECSGQ
jgi:hypothetical protein